MSQLMAYPANYNLSGEERIIYFSIWQEGQKSMARQAETDEQALLASPVCHTKYLQHVFLA